MEIQKHCFYRNFISFLPVLLRRKWRSSIIYYLHYYFGYNNALSLLITYVFLKEKKILLSLLLILVCTASLSICGIVTQINTGGKIDSTLIEFLLNYIVINIFTVLLSVYFIEEMIEKYKMKENCNGLKILYS